jgi:hypothetical protein
MKVTMRSEAMMKLCVGSIRYQGSAIRTESDFMTGLANLESTLRNHGGAEVKTGFLQRPVTNGSVEERF